jgi:hypothetical protein
MASAASVAPGAENSRIQRAEGCPAPAGDAPGETGRRSPLGERRGSRDSALAVNEGSALWRDRTGHARRRFMVPHTGSGRTWRRGCAAPRESRRAGAGMSGPMWISFRGASAASSWRPLTITDRGRLSRRHRAQGDAIGREVSDHGSRHPVRLSERRTLPIPQGSVRDGATGPVRRWPEPRGRGARSPWRSSAIRSSGDTRTGPPAAGRSSRG